MESQQNLWNSELQGKGIPELVINSQHREFVLIRSLISRDKQHFQIFAAVPDEHRAALQIWAGS